MTLNIENLVRSGVVLAVCLPLTIGVTSKVTERPEVTEVDKVTNEFKAQLVRPCVGYMVSKNDSKLERTSQNEIDDILGGEVNHKGVCDWVL
jgi:hypothetical protein